MRILKTIFSIFLLTGMIAGVNAQSLEPVKWEFSSIEEANGLIAISITAHMDEGWHVYATYLPSNEGPVATKILIESSEEYELIGVLEYPDPIVEYDPNFMMEVNYYEGSVTFKRYLKWSGKGTLEVRGSLEFMCCNSEMCLPPRSLPISVELKK